MAKKKLKRAGKVAAAIGAAYLASQALGKKKPKSTSIVRKKGDTFGADTAQDYAASRPRDTFESDTAATYENVPGTKFLSTPGGFSIGEKGSGTTTSPVDESDYMSQNEGFGPMAKDGKFISKKGDRFTDKDIELAGDIAGSIAPYRAAKNKKGSSKVDITSTEGSFVRGGSVVARGNKLARSKPTKLF